MYSSQIHIRVREGEAHFRRRKTRTGEILSRHRINAHKYSCFVYYMGERIPNVDEQKVKYNQFVKNGLKYCYICVTLDMLFGKVHNAEGEINFFEGHPAKEKQRQRL